MELESGLSAGYLRVWQKQSLSTRCELEDLGVLLLFAGQTGVDLGKLVADLADLPTLRELLKAAAPEAELQRKILAKQGTVHFARMERQRRENEAKKPKGSQTSQKDVDIEEAPRWH